MATVVGLPFWRRSARTNRSALARPSKLEAGDAIELVVGSSVLVMKKDSSITVTAGTSTSWRTKHIQLDSKRIDLN